jgi:hypothetical protein
MIKNIKNIFIASAIIISFNSFDRVGGMEPQRSPKRPAEKILIQEAQKKLRTAVGNTLVLAIRAGDQEKVRELLAQNPDLAISSIDMRTPLHYAAFYHQPAIVRMLIEYIKARFKNSLDQVAFIDAGNPEASPHTTEGRTPLHDLFMGLREEEVPYPANVINNVFEIALLLLENGADPNAAAPPSGVTPFDLVLTFPRNVRRRLIPLLIEYGANSLNPEDTKLIAEALPSGLERAVVTHNIELFNQALKTIPANPSPALRYAIDRAYTYALAQGRGPAFIQPLEKWRPSPLRARDVLRSILVRPGLTPEERMYYNSALIALENRARELENFILQRGAQQPNLLQLFPAELRQELLRFAGHQASF